LTKPPLPGASVADPGPDRIGHASTRCRPWTSPASGLTYPQNWTVTVPSGQLTVTALEPDQEMTNLGSTGNNWEGDSSVSGTIHGVAVTGQSYAEIMPNTTTMPQPGDLTGL
jgi:hypothetical protein